MTSINVNFENLTEDERAELERLVDKSNKSSLQGFRPHYGEQYFYIDERGEVNFFYNRNSPYDKMCYSIGNCFKTKEEAEFEVEKLKIVAQLKRMAKAWNTCEIDWEDEQQLKYYLRYSSEGICWASTSLLQTGAIYFTDKEFCKAAIAFIGEERLKKYYFGVKK